MIDFPEYLHPRRTWMRYFGKRISHAILAQQFKIKIKIKIKKALH
jgi:hypothetical protein